MTSRTSSPPPAAAPRRLVGVDFTSRPTRRKPITVAFGETDDGRVAAGNGNGNPDPDPDPDPDRDGAGSTAVTLRRIEAHADFTSFARWLRSPGPWLAVFDLPFGLPRELVVALGWPLDWPALMRHYAALSRPEIRATFSAFCAGRPVGAKFAHRRADRPAGSSPSMKWVNPPVAFMLHAGVPLLIDAGLHLPGLQSGDPLRIGLEGYPGLLARELLGRRPYKSDERRKQTPERLQARLELIDALVAGRTGLGLRLRLTPGQRDDLLADASGDRLDAVLCMLQAAWADRRPDHGLPADVDPLEGWIVTAAGD